MKKFISLALSLILIISIVLSCVPTVSAAMKPIKKFAIDDQVLYAYVDGDYYYDSNGDTIFIYDLEPESLNVEFTDGTKFTGTPREFESMYGRVIDYTGDTSPEIQWRNGSTHIVKATCGSLYCIFKVTIKEVITSVEIAKEPIIKEYKADEMPSVRGAVLKIGYLNGESFELPLTELIDFNGYMMYYDPVIEERVPLVCDIFADNTDTFYTTTVILGGKKVNFYSEHDPVRVLRSSLSEDTDGKLHLHIYYSDGSVTDYRIETVEEFVRYNSSESEDGYVQSTSVVAVKSDTDKWILGGFIYDNLKSDDVKYRFSNVSFVSSEATNIIEGSKWLDDAITFQNVAKIVATEDFTTGYTPYDFEGFVTEENLDCLAIIAAAYCHQSEEYTMTIEEYDGYPYVSMTESQLEEMIKSLFKVEGDLDFSNCIAVWDMGDGTVMLPLVHPEMCSPSYDTESEKTDGGFKFSENISTTAEIGSDIGVTAEFDENGLITSLVLDRIPLMMFTYTDGTFKSEYEYGEELDTTGLYISVIFKDGMFADFEVTPDMIEGFDGTRAGEKELTVNYKGLTDTVTVNVKPRFMIGDANGDGDVTSKDVLLLRKIVAGVCPASEAIFEAADYNGDGDITSKDVLAVRKVVAGVA